MKSSRKIRVWVERLVITGALLFVLYRLGPQLAALIGLNLGTAAAPDISVVTLDGRVIQPDDLRGSVLVVNFWATWCGPCRLEMPSLQSLHEDHAEDGLLVLGLSTDTGSDVPIRAFLSEKNITYPVARAPRQLIEAFGEIPMIPTTFIIDRKGIIRHRIEGYAPPPVFSVAVGRLLDEAS